MARLTIEDCWWTDPRRSALIRELGTEKDADWAAMRAWRLAQEFWKHGRGLVPKVLFDTLEHAAVLVRTKLADVRGENVYVRGSSQYLDWVREQRDLASAAGKKSAEARRKKHGSAQPQSSKKTERKPNASRTEPNVAEPSVSVFDSVSDSDLGSRSESFATGSKNSSNELTLEPEEEAGKGGARPDGSSPTALAWRAYRDAFEKRHGHAPPWNAKTAGQLKSFVSRIPASAAPDVAAFYLTHNDAYYIRSMHPVGMLLKDAEKLHTEWKTGRQVTGTGARQAEKFGHAADQIRRIREGTL